MKICSFVLLFLCFSLVAMTLSAQRFKRRVVFNKNSKFFIRLNGKTNVLNTTGIFAHGWAIRINYELPDTIPKMNKIFKRSLEQPGENGYDRLATSCVTRHICEMFENSINSNSCGFFCGIKRIIYSSRGPKADYLKALLDNCDFNINKCSF